METQKLTPKTEMDFIKDAIFRARQFHFDGKLPDVKDIEHLENDLYESLFGYRDKLGDTPRNCPVKFTLEEVFTDLKFGRTVADQQFLEHCINLFNNKEPVAKN